MDNEELGEVVNTILQSQGLQMTNNEVVIALIKNHSEELLDLKNRIIALENRVQRLESPLERLVSGG